MDVMGPAYCRRSAYRAFAAELPHIHSAEGLFRAAWAISTHELPDANVTEGEQTISKLANALLGQVRSRSPEALLAHLHDVLFDGLGFRGNVDDYYNPANSYLPSVLDSRRGLPITLSLVYRRVAAGVGLVVHGVNAPGHFLAEVELSDAGKASSMYVDPFYRGRLLSSDEVFQRICQTTGRSLTPDAELVRRATPREWLARMLHNLQAAFAATHRQRDVYAMQELQSLL